MKQFKQLLASALLFFSAGAWAQTDVTSTYLTNADFSQTTASTAAKVYGYGKDGTPYGLQAVDGWTSVVLSGDNSNASYPNSGMAGVVVAYGSSTLLQGGGKAAPAADPEGNAGNCFGFFAVWGCGAYYYQDVTLAAGKYTLTFPIYNQQGTQANTTYTGFFPTSGTNRTVAINTTVGSWVNQTVTFTLAAATEGQIRIGYKSTGNGSGANPHLFFDGVKIEYTALVVKDVLETALTAATNANVTLNSNDLTSAIATAQAVYDNADATQEQVNNAAATLNVATELAMSAAGDVTGIFLTNPGFESSTVTTTNAAAGGSAAPLDIAGDWTQVSSAAWSSSAVVAYGGSGQVNGASAPSADNAGNSGNALGVSVGWGGLVTYQSPAITLPAGVYTLKVNAYNNLSGVTQFTSKFGFVPTEGSATLSTKAAFAYATWEEDKVTFTLNEATGGKIQVGGQAISGGSGANAKVFFDNITITYQSFIASAKDTWDEAVADAEQAKTECVNVTGSELTALNTELAKAEPTTVAGYNEAETALETATATFRAAKANYDALVAEIAYAKTIGIAASTADGYAATSESTAATVLTSTQNLKVAEYTHITTTYTEPATLGSWTENFAEDLNGEGYVDNGPKYFNEWGTATRTAKQTLTLPAGDYAISVIARGQEGTSGYLYYKIGENETKTSFNMKGNRGRGVNTSGEASFSDSDTYTCNNEGFGWEYRYLTFTLAAETQVEIGVSATFANQWVSVYAPQLLTTEATVKAVTLSLIAAELEDIPEGKMNADVQTALNTKKSAAEAASASNTKDELNTILEELRTAKTNATASIAAYTTANEKLAAMKQLTEQTNIYTAAAKESYYGQWATKYDANTLTDAEAEALQNPFTTTGWHAAINADDFLLDAWNTNPDFTDAPYYINTWSTEGNSDGSGMTTPFFEYFVDNSTTAKLGERTLTATLNGIAEGNYYADVLVRIGKNSGEENAPTGITMDINGGTATDLCTGVTDTNGRFYGTFRAIGTVGSDGVMNININVAAENNVHWLAFKNVTYAAYAAATSQQKDDLASALAEAESKTLGFQSGEYAPYNNIAAIKTKDEVKGLNVDNATGEEVQNAITALTSASWTANSADVDAIYNPDFSLIEGEWEPEGWTRTNGWGTKVTDAASSTGKGYYNQSGSMQYGNNGTYTMPLAAETNYKLTFKYGYRDQDVTPTISVLNGNNEGLAATSLATAYSGNNYKTAMIAQTMYFKTGAAGYYVLTMAGNKNIVLSDVSLVKTDAANTVIDEASTTAPEVAYYQTLTLTRTLSSEYWNTFCSPVAITAEEITAKFGEGTKVREMDTNAGITDNVVTFKDATAITAGKPYLVKPAQTVTNPTFAGKTVVASGQTIENGDYKFIGILTQTSLAAPAADATALDLYLSTDGTMKKPGTNGATLKGMRAYFNVPVAAAQAGVKLFIAGEDITTSIDEIDGQHNVNAPVYNLAGQRVGKAQKGIYIVNGKKVLVK